MYNKQWLPFKEARRTVRKEARALGIDTERKWQYYKNYGYKRPSNIPYSPNIIYQGKGRVFE
jgi:hypothetical protein